MAGNRVAPSGIHQTPTRGPERAQPDSGSMGATKTKNRINTDRRLPSVRNVGGRSVGGVGLAVLGASPGTPRVLDRRRR
jgi:hypothetical protein